MFASVLFYITSQTGAHVQCYDHDGNGEKTIARIIGVKKTVTFCRVWTYWVQCCCCCPFEYRIISNISTVSNNSTSPIIEHLGAAFKK